MFNPEETKIAFFGGANNKSAVRAVRALSDAGFQINVGTADPRENSYIQRKTEASFYDSYAEALEGVNIILTSCATPDDVEDLYCNEGGLLELMEKGQSAVDLSFSTPQLAREIHALAAVKDLVVLDAPVINVGSKEQTVAFIGGEKDAIEALSPIFPYLAPSIYPQTKPGEGQFAAVLAIITFAASIMSTVEALAMQRTAGFSNKSALKILSFTNSNSGVLHDYAPRIKSRDYSGVITVASFLNSLEVVIDTAQDLDLSLPMIENCYQLFDLLSVVGGRELNIQALALLYEDENTCKQFGLDWSLADEYTEKSLNDDLEDDDNENSAFNTYFSNN